MLRGTVASFFCLCILGQSTAQGRGALTPQGGQLGGSSGKAEQYYQRGLTETQSGQDTAAIADFEQSIALDPDRYETYSALDEVLNKHRQWAIAVQYWNQYIQLHPEDGRGYCERGAAYSWLHDGVRMGADAEKACSLGDQHCCEVVRTHRRAPPPPPPAEPFPRFFWALMSLVLSSLVLLALSVISLVWSVVWPPKAHKALGSMDMSKRTSAGLFYVGDLDRPASTFSLLLYGTMLAGICLIILFYVHLVSAVGMLNLLGPVTLAMIGVILFLRGFAIYREFRVVLTTAESKIKGLAMGFVEVHGKATGEETVASVVTGTPCFYCKAILMEKNKSGQEVRGNPFYLEDATGKVRVDPTGLECDLLPNYQAEQSQGIGSVEYCVLPGHWYDLAGTCVQNPHPQDDEDRNMIVKGSEESTFLVSWRSEEGIKAKVRHRAVYCIFMGGALIVTGAIIGLWLYYLL